MPTLTIENLKTVEVTAGTKLVLAIEDAGVDILHRCGGNARCTTCRVQIVSGDPGAMENLERDRLAQESELGPDIRLSCQVRIQGDLTVRALRTASATAMAAGPRPMD